MYVNLLCVSWSVLRSSPPSPLLSLLLFRHFSCCFFESTTNIRKIYHDCCTCIVVIQYAISQSMFVVCLRHFEMIRFHSTAFRYIPAVVNRIDGALAMTCYSDCNDLQCRGFTLVTRGIQGFVHQKLSKSTLIIILIIAVPKSPLWLW